MPGQIIVPPSGPPIATFKYLDDIVTILGGTKMAFYPFLATKGTDIFPYGAANDGLVAASSAAIETAFDPIPLAGGVNALYIDSSASVYIAAADDANYSHGNGTADMVRRARKAGVDVAEIKPSI